VAARPFVANVAEIRRHPGSRTRFAARAPLDGVAITSAAVPPGAEIAVDLELEALTNGIVATGTVTVPWEGECRRCLRPVRAETVAEIREIFEPDPVEGETYPLSGDQVDLGPMVRDAALLALPLAPLCGPDCLGPAPAEFPTGVERDDGAEADEEPTAPAPDPRWAALDELRFDSGDDAR